MKNGKPSPEFNGHKVVRPKLLDGRSQVEIRTTQKNPVSQQKQHQHHLRDVTLILPGVGGGGSQLPPRQHQRGSEAVADADDVVVDLKLTETLIPDSYFEKTHKQVSE